MNEQKPSIGRIGDAHAVHRFWSKVQVPDDHRKDCWIWLASLDKQGYGQFRIDGLTRKAHQIAYEALHGEPVPQGLELDHICHNRRCLNPYHLSLSLIKKTVVEVTDGPDKPACVDTPGPSKTRSCVQTGANAESAEMAESKPGTIEIRRSRNESKNRRSGPLPTLWFARRRAQV